jgi:tripartite-type tricarboxylate transporter receptor subunit TctC
MLKKLVCFAVASLPFLPVSSSAQDNYPNRPIRMVVGFAAGSSGDVAARIVTNKLTELLGQPVVVENRAGASGLIASDNVARSAKDGYSLLFATVANTINTTLMPGKGPNFEKDFEPITLVGSLPGILVINPNVPVNDVKGLIALAKEKPTEIMYGASGLGSGPQMAAELFKQMAGVQMTAVLYPGSSQQVTDLIAGRIHVMFSPASTVLAFIQNGSVKALATTEAKRATIAPDLPTIAEAGLPGYNAGVWFGILAPTGTPPAITEKLSKATNQTLTDPEVLKQLHAQGLEALGGSPDEFRRYIRSETERWARVVNGMNAQKKD